MDNETDGVDDALDIGLECEVEIHVLGCEEGPVRRCAIILRRVKALVKREVTGTVVAQVATTKIAGSLRTDHLCTA